MNISESEEALRERYAALVLEDEEEDVIPVPVIIAPRSEFYFVGVYFTNKDFDEKAMQRTLSRVWDPREGVNFRCIGPNNRFLITFFHQRDHVKAWDDSPWTFNNKLFALAPRKNSEDPVMIKVLKVPMRIQVFGVPTGYVSLTVCEAVGRFAGEFIAADENNFKMSRPVYIRVRVMININKPIKHKKRLCLNERNCVIVQFQYERLPSMCLICGSFYHTDSQCPLTYVSETTQPKHMYDPSIRAVLRKNMITEEDYWLRDENGRSLVPTGAALRLKEIEAARRPAVGKENVDLNRMEEDESIVITINDPKRRRSMELDGSNEHGGIFA